eukprot:4452440-Amphidinium_carterae.3
MTHAWFRAGPLHVCLCVRLFNSLIAIVVAQGYSAKKQFSVPPQICQCGSVHLLACACRLALLCEPQLRDTGWQPHALVAMSAKGAEPPLAKTQTSSQRKCSSFRLRGKLQRWLEFKEREMVGTLSVALPSARVVVASYFEQQTTLLSHRPQAHSTVAAEWLLQQRLQLTAKKVQAEAGLAQVVESTGKAVERHLRNLQCRYVGQPSGKGKNPAARCIPSAAN